MDILSNTLFYSYMNCRKSQVLRQLTGKAPIEYLFFNAYEDNANIYKEIMQGGKNGWSYPWAIELDNELLGIQEIEVLFENFDSAEHHISDMLSHSSEVYIWTRNKYIPHMEMTDSDPDGEHSLTLTSYVEGSYSVIDYPFEQSYSKEIIQAGFDHVNAEKRTVTRYALTNPEIDNKAKNKLILLFEHCIQNLSHDFSIYDGVVNDYHHMEWKHWMTRTIQVFGVISLSRALTSLFMNATSFSEASTVSLQHISKSAESIKNYLMKATYAPKRFDINTFQEKCDVLKQLDMKCLQDIQHEIKTGVKKTLILNELSPPNTFLVEHVTDTSMWLVWEDPQQEFESIQYDIFLNNELIASCDCNQYTIPNLEPLKDYSVHIIAKNQYGQISEKKQVVATTTELKTHGNLSSYKPVFASSVESKEFLSCFVVDGNPATRWSSDYNDNQSIYVDLGWKKEFNKIRLHWEGAHALAYDIQISEDAEEWSTIYSEHAGKEGIHELDNLNLVGRYVRIVCHKRATIFGYSLWEFSVFNSK